MQENNKIIFDRLTSFINSIEALPNDTTKNKMLKLVFNNREGELLMKAYKDIKDKMKQ
jgi:hypothetical protein